MNPSQPFLDISLLLEQSQPRPRGGWSKYALMVFVLLVLFSAYAGQRSESMRLAVEGFSMMAMIGVMTAMSILTWRTVQKHRGEQRQLEAAEELVQLRRWPQAAGLLQEMLSRPTRSPQARIQALIYLISVLSRYHRFADAITLQDYLLEHVRMDEPTSHALRLGRAMGLLHEDRLFDADRAISDLRRTTSGTDSGGLALIEIYRDVKTGHPAEAIEIFNQKLSAMRRQLGHRVADAYALAAKAYDLLGREADARRAYEDATILALASELHRRYPEVATLAERYSAAAGPEEAM